VITHEIAGRRYEKLPTRDRDRIVLALAQRWAQRAYPGERVRFRILKSEDSERLTRPESSTKSILEGMTT
jgi:hypothetical protein